jgi:hypothetical protein
MVRVLDVDFVMNRGEKLASALLRMTEINFDVNFGKAASERNFDVTYGGLHVKHSMQRGIWVQTEHLL